MRNLLRSADNYFHLMRGEEPLVILITGASHTGKTLLAQKFLEKYRYPYLSMDHLKMGLIRSGHTDLTPEDDDALTGFLWPIVREIIRTAIENDQNLIVEGCYVPFDWRQDFEERELLQIRFLCLVMSDHYIRSHFQKILDHESDIEHRLYSHDCTLEQLLEDNRRYMNGFLPGEEKIVLIEEDYLSTMNRILQSI